MAAPAPPSVDALAAKAGALKSSGDTKAADALALDPAAIEALSKLFNDNGGDIAKLAAATGCDAALMAKYAPADAADFAKKVLSGKYVAA